MSITAIDPFGNKVILPKALIPSAEITDRHLGIYDTPGKVIERPALLLTTCNGAVSECTSPCELHYLRSVSWEQVWLISARKEEENWVAYQCICNPSTEQMADLYLHTQQLIG